MIASEPAGPDGLVCSKGPEFETLAGDEITDLLAGKKPNRESVIEPQQPRSSAVPPAGRARPRPSPETGPMKPQPQT